MIYNVIDLFAGAGGLSLGFKQTGQVKIVAAAENNLNARKTYKRNFKLARLYSDVRTIDYAELQDTVGPVDIVIGGPPCQGFSNANRQHTTVISMNNRLVKEYVRVNCHNKRTDLQFAIYCLVQQSVYFADLVCLDNRTEASLRTLQVIYKLCNTLFDTVLKALASEGGKEINTQIVTITYNINGYIKSTSSIIV